MEVVSLYSTWPDQQRAEAAGEALIEARLAACVNIIPNIRSLYRWNGQIQRETEVVMLVKTSLAKAPAARDALLAAHPYETPCLLHLHTVPENSAPAFAAWVQAETADAATL
jgi:periplasmic divalent cation tolerance protein